MSLASQPPSGTQLPAAGASMAGAAVLNLVAALTPSFALLLAVFLPTAVERFPLSTPMVLLGVGALMPKRVEPAAGGRTTPE